MNLLDLFVRIGAKDEASSEVEQLSNNMVGKLGSAAATVGKALAGAFAVKKVVDFGKEAFDAYAEFEQLSGGIQKLYGNAGKSIEEYAKDAGKAVSEVTEEYQRNAEAERLLFDNAQQAWKTAGMTANEYMNTATQFSASLITSLGGDTEKAAEITDRAMSAISDNVNTFGSDAESVQNAILGISKGNYTMLDNLKLGFAGTKEGAKALVDAANEWGAANGEASNLSVDSFADMIVAIEQVQKAQGIYGTTSREALTTIEGSMNATKAAWQNLVAEFGKEDGDIGARVADMFTAVMGENGEGGLLKNVTKRVGVIAKSIVTNVGQGVSDGIKWLADNAPKAINDAVKSVSDTVRRWADGLKDSKLDLAAMLGDESSLIGRVTSLLTSVGGAIVAAMPTIMETLGTVMESVGQWLVDNGPAIVAKLGEVGQAVLAWLGEAWQNLVNFLIENGPQILSTLADTGMQVLAWLSEMLPQIVGNIGETLANIVNYIVEHREEILAAVGEAIQGIIGAIVENGPVILQNVATAVGELLGYLIGAAAELLGGLLQSLKDHWPEIKDWFINLPQTILDTLGDLGGLLLQAGKDLIGGLIKGVTESVSGVGKALLDGIGGAVDGAKSFLGISSPSKLFDWMGEMSMKGLAGGITDAAGEAEKAASKAVSSVYDSASGTIDVSMTSKRDNAILDVLTSIRDNIGSDIYLDSGRLVGSMAPQMNVAMGRL